MVPGRPALTIGGESSGGRRARRLTVALLAALTLAGPAHADAKDVFTAEEIGAALDKAFDLTVTRPLGLGRIVFGVVCFIPAGIFAELPPLPGGDSKRWRSSVGEAWQTFVGDQIEATFMTPLGEFEEEY